LNGGLVGDHSAHGTAHAVGDFGINGRPHDIARIDAEVELGSVERWFIGGGGVVEHPFHVHGVHFRIVSEGGGAPARPENRGWKDTVVISGETEIIARFTHSAGREAPFMYHCHILEHEDAGMMGQFTVI
jgi:FtsP/CotA-like multicopper oxidase with cupredoxin domain